MIIPVLGMDNLLNSQDVSSNQLHVPRENVYPLPRASSRLTWFHFSVVAQKHLDVIVFGSCRHTIDIEGMVHLLGIHSARKYRASRSQGLQVRRFTKEIFVQKMTYFLHFCIMLLSIAIEINCNVIIVLLLKEKYINYLYICEL